MLSSWGSWLCTVKNGKKCSSKIRALLKKPKIKKCEISVTKKDIEKIPTILIFWAKSYLRIFHQNQRTSFFHGRQWVQTCLSLNNQINLHAASWHRGDFAHVYIYATLKDFFHMYSKHLPPNTHNIVAHMNISRNTQKMFHVGTSLLTRKKFCT